MPCRPLPLSMYIKDHHRSTMSHVNGSIYPAINCNHILQSCDTLIISSTVRDRLFDMYYFGNRMTVALMIGGDGARWLSKSGY